jgi:hypothetical protein
MNPSQPSAPTEFTGPYGTAHRIPHANYHDQNPAALDAWIITADCWHPTWSQYLLAVVTLADIDGIPPANKRGTDVTHELLVIVLNPEHGPYDAATATTKTLQHLTPVNIAEQFTTTDDQARTLTELCARACVDGVLTPENGDAPDRIRAYWRSTIRQTLDHDHHQEH